MKLFFITSIICSSCVLASCGSAERSGDFNPPPKVPGRASYFDSEFLVVNCEQEIPQFTLSSMESKPSSSTTQALCSCIADEASLRSGKISQLKIPRALNLCTDKFNL